MMKNSAPKKTLKKAKDVKLAKPKAAIKPRVVYRDTIQSFINSPTAKRILYVGSRMHYGLDGMRMSGYVKEEIAAVAKMQLEDLIKNACILAAHAKRTTINTSDIVEGARILGSQIYPIEEEIEVVKSLDELKKMTKTKSKAKSPEGISITSKAGFSRFAREIAQDFSPRDFSSTASTSDFRFSAKALLNARMWLEHRLIKIVGKASQLAFNVAGRKTVMPKDISAARSCFEN